MHKSKFIKNLSFVLLSNVFNLLISILLVVLIPRKIGVTDFGNWQIYLLYSSYAGILLFGWNDGIYLRFGGIEYSKLPKRNFAAQIYYVELVQLIILFLINILITLFSTFIVDVFVLRMISISIFITNSSGLPLSILQASNRLSDFSIVNILSKILFFILILIYYFSRMNNFKFLFYSDLISKFFLLLYSFFLCKDLFLIKFREINFEINEAILNISIGMKLMLSNFASMLIIGIIRVGIEKIWDINTFAQVSMTLSISSLMMIFVNALGIVIFPLLRKISTNELGSIYISTKTLLVSLLLSLLTMYYPLKVLLLVWMPKYAQSLFYMGLIFPILIYEGKTALLSNTFLKVLRKESQLLKTNIMSMFISILSVIICSIILRNLQLTVLSITVTLFFRSIIFEWYISKSIQIEEAKSNSMETLIVFIFIFANIYFDISASFFIYLFCIIIYLIFRFKKIKESLVCLFQSYKLY